MREIKFRAWDKINSKILRGGISLYMSDCSRHSTFHNFKGDTPSSIILMQYTGLKDKNGKEIYEGDIAKHGWDFTTPHGTKRKGDELGVVHFSETGEWVYDNERGLNPAGSHSLWESNANSKNYSFEIIGNTTRTLSC